MFGVDYVWEVVRDLLGSDPNKRGAVRLDDDVKAAITDFLGNKIKSDRLDGNWLSFHDNPHIEVFLPYNRAPEFQRLSHGQRYTRCVMTWYVATWYCELEEQEREMMQNGPSTVEEVRGCRGTCANYLEQAAEAVAGCLKKATAAGEGEENQNSHRRVANALSKYCAYLVVSVPELLPGLSVDTRREYESFVRAARQARNKDTLLKAMLNSQFNTDRDNINVFGREDPQFGGAPLVAEMCGPDRWKMLVDVWVRMLAYAAPYGNAEAHMQQLSRGGEFITHLWALLYHFGIREWKFLGNVLDVVTIDQAQRILTESFHRDKNKYILTQDQDNHAIVVAFLRSQSDSCSDELAAASELEKHVSFYRTTSPEIAQLFHIDPAANLPSLVLLKREEEKLTLYDGEFKRYSIADFVSANKLPLVTTLTPKTVSSLDCHPIHKLIILLAVANESKKILPNFKEAAKSFKGKLLFVFVELDNKEAKHAAENLLDITCTGQETRVFAYYPREDEIIFELHSELSLDNIKIFAQGAFEDKLYVSEPVPESNDEDVKTVVGKNIDQIVLDESKDVLLVIHKPDEHRFRLFMESSYNKLAKHLRGIDSLVIAKMDSTTNWHPRTKCYGDSTILFYPAGRKRFEPINFKGEQTAEELYKFIKKHASIPFEPISTLEEVSSEYGTEEILPYS
ncbi:unnamed protein product [Urochloa humidicola]